jgi:DNA-binding transcriptional regulator YiaG
MDEADLVSRIRRAAVLPPPEERVALRRRLGIQQAEVARAVGVSVQTVWAWEHGRSEPTGERRTAYSRLLAEMAGRAAGTGDAR